MGFSAIHTYRARVKTFSIQMSLLMHTESLLLYTYLNITDFISCRKTLFTEVHNLVHLNLAIALFVAYLVFAVGVELGAKNEVCLSL